MTGKINIQTLLISVIFTFAAAVATFAQTTVFTYQGKLTDSGTAQTTYQMQFKLFDAISNGNQIGETNNNPSVAVSAGIFTVNLDFGAAAFGGENRFLEISVRRNTGDPFTVLTPRQAINGVPYSITSVNALNLGGLSAGSFLQNEGDGAGLTNLNADQLNSGTVNDARLSPNVAKLDAENTFTASGNSFPQITLAGDGQILAARLENAAKDPAPATADNAGRVYFNTTNGSLTVSDGTSWKTLAPKRMQTFSGNAAGSVSCLNGIIQNVTFTKNSAATRLRITYQDQIYIFGSSSTFRVQIKLFIDNAAISPLSLQKGFLGSSYITQTGTFYGVESPVTMVGYAENVAAGTHTLSSKYLANGNGVCTKGDGGNPFLIEIEEVQ